MSAHFNYIQMVTYFILLLNSVWFSVLNHAIYKIKTVVVAISHMMSPLAAKKQNQNQNMEAYTHIDMQRYVENSWHVIIELKLHKNYKEFEWKSNKKSYFPVVSIFVKKNVYFPGRELPVNTNGNSRHRYIPTYLDMNSTIYRNVSARNRCRSVKK